MPTDVAKLKIDAEFSALLAPLTEAESTSLRESIILEGCLMPLIAWRGILIDGHNRYKICRELHKPFNVIEIALPNREAAFNWIIDHQLARRNITPEQASYLRGKKYKMDKSQGERSDLTSGKNCQKLPTAVRLAKECGVSERTIRNDAKFAEAVDKLPEPLKAEVLSGKSEATKAEISKLGNITNAKEREKAAKAVVAGEGLPKPKAAKNTPSPAAVEPVKDALGNVIKDKAVAEAFLTVELIDDQMQAITGIKRELNIIATMPVGAWLCGAILQDVLKQLDAVRYQIKTSRPHALTPAELLDDENGELSKRAKQVGWITEKQWKMLKGANGK
jgi:hypothetical protein